MYKISLIRGHNKNASSRIARLLFFVILLGIANFASAAATYFYPVSDSLARTYAWTGRGGYKSYACTVDPSTCSFTVAGIPATATILDAFLYTMAENANDTQGSEPVFLNTINLLWYGHADGLGDEGIIGIVESKAALTKRWNVGPTGAKIVTGNGSYSMSGTTGGASGWMAASLFVLYEDPSLPCTTIVMGQGLDFAADTGTDWASYTLDWSDQNNPVATVPDVTIEWHGFAGTQGGTPAEAYRIYTDNTYSTVAWTSTTNIQPSSTGSNLYSVSFTAAPFSAGQTSVSVGGQGLESGGLYVYTTVLQNKNNASLCNTVVRPIAISMTKSASPTIVATGAAVTYSFVACNNGSLGTGGDICTDDFNDGKISGFAVPSGTSFMWSPAADYITETGGVLRNNTFNDLVYVKTSCTFRSATVCADKIWTTDGNLRGMILKMVSSTSRSIYMDIDCASSGANCDMYIRQMGITYSNAGTLIGSVTGVNLTGTQTICAFIGGGRIVLSVGGTVILNVSQGGYIPDTDVGFMGFASSTGTFGNTYTNMSVDSTNAAITGGDLTNVRVWDTIPTGITYVGCTGGCTQSGSLVSWTIGTLAPLACTTVTYWGTVNQAGPSYITNIAKVDAAEEWYGPYASNNVTVTVIAAITPTAVMPLSKSANVAVATIGDTITYTISWANDSTATAAVKIWDTLWTNLTYLGCSNACTSSPPLVSWSFSATSNTAGTVQVWARVNGYPWIPELLQGPKIAIEKIKLEDLYLAAAPLRLP